MRKPISKHALRRAIERVHTEGLLRWEEPVGTVVDRIWHELEKEAYHNDTRKKAPARKRAASPAGPTSPEYLEPEHLEEA